MPREPLVSVLITSYNYARYLEEAIGSVYAQTYRNIELIIVDDGSEDDSREAIGRAVRHAPFCTKSIFKTHGGQASALNAGFDMARGELVCLLDSDDAWRPEKVERMVRFALERPDGGVYQHQLDAGNGQPKRNSLMNGDILAQWRELGEVNVAVHSDMVAVFVPSTGLMWRKAILERIFPIPEALVACPDAYLTRSACCYGPLYSLHEVLGSWRDHGKNAGKNGFNFRRFWVPVVMPAINEFFARNGVPVRYVHRPEEKIG